jgi:hypothetical protein
MKVLTLLRMALIGLAMSTSMLAGCGASPDAADNGSNANEVKGGSSAGARADSLLQGLFSTKFMSSFDNVKELDSNAGPMDGHVLSLEYTPSALVNKPDPHGGGEKMGYPDGFELVVQKGPRHGSTLLRGMPTSVTRSQTCSNNAPTEVGIINIHFSRAQTAQVGTDGEITRPPETPVNFDYCYAFAQACRGPAGGTTFWLAPPSNPDANAANGETYDCSTLDPSSDATDQFTYDEYVPHDNSTSHGPCGAEGCPPGWNDHCDRSSQVCS